MMQPFMHMAQMFQQFQGGTAGGGAPACNLQMLTPPTQGRRLSFQSDGSPAAGSQEESPPAEPVLALPDLPVALSPEEQQKLVADAKAAKSEAKDAEPKAKAKSKGKAKAKASAKSNGKAKSNPKSKAKSKAAAGSKASGSEPAATVEEAHPKAKVDRKVYRLGDALPGVPAQGDPTAWYRAGKIHRNSGCFRVFLRSSDRCDKKIKITDGNEQEAWEKALGLIDKSLEGAEAEDIE